MTFDGNAALKVEEPVFIRFMGHDLMPLISGALYWPAECALLVADLHLEKMSSFSRRGSFLPPYDTGLTLRRLAADIAGTGAEHVIALGDSFHRDYGTESLIEHDRALLNELTGRASWTWLSGNHDPAPHKLGGACLKSLERAGLHMTHHPRRGVVAGHLHPAARVVINGRSVRRPCFVHDGETMILPAYGSAAGSINILTASFLPLFDWDALEVTMIGRDRVYPVGRRRLVGG